MAPRRKQTARERRQPRQRWTLGNEAPSWLRRIWRERSRETPKTSVLNAHNQVWDAPNVYVTDGACMTSSACVNPSLTYMALTARAADHAVRELKAGNL